MATRDLFKAAKDSLRARIERSGLPPPFDVPVNQDYFIHPTGKVSYSSKVYAFTGPSVTRIDNWSKCDILIGSHRFEASEQVIFAACKAALFNDKKSFQTAVGNPSMTPATAKKLGRSVLGFDDVIWKASAPWISDIALTIKALQNEDVLEELLRTRGKLICEASAKDLLWGIGAEARQVELALVPEHWKGKNELGRSLMRVRWLLLDWAGISTEDEALAPVLTEENVALFYSWFDE
ncbi:hypothetical protein BDR26DRAFT_240271 [Obelidium mucronatum]|nr:hypothetical protein BDR26DRAFT_240271 [Obelidium mucronatum]